MTRLSPLLLLAPAFLGVAWLISRAQWYWSHNPDLQFGYVVVLLCAYLFHEGWGMRPPIVWRLRVWAILAALGGMALMFLVQIYEATMGGAAPTTLGLAIGVTMIAAGNLGLTFGWPGVRTLGMAFAFLLVAIPLPSGVEGPVVSTLQNKVASVNTEILNLIGIPAEQVGSLIHLPNGTVGIDEACSGIRSIQSTIMASLFIGYLTLKRNGLRLALLGLGIGLAIIGNLARSLYLCLTAYSKGIEAIDKVHDAAGWSILAFTAVGVICISWFLGKLEKAAQAQVVA